MKATLLFTTLSMLLAVPGVSAMTELETLKARCSEQERQIQRLEERVRQLSGSPAQAAKPVAAASSASSGSHTVRPGESLERIARRNGCTVGRLAKLNGLRTTSVIHPGQKLKLPGQSAAPAAAPAPAAETGVSPLMAGKTHKIRQGETYASISRKYQTSVQSLMAANPTVKATALRPGQVIRLSAETPVKPLATQSSKPAPAMAAAPAQPRSTGHGATSYPISTTRPAPQPVAKAAPQTPAEPAKPAVAPSPAPKPEAAPAPAPAAAATQPAAAPAESTPQESLSPSNPEKKIRSVTIEGEMTYGEFATAHGTDTARLNDLNGLDLTHATVLAKGSELYVPAQP